MELDIFTKTRFNGSLFIHESNVLFYMVPVEIKM